MKNFKRFFKENPVVLVVGCAFIISSSMIVFLVDAGYKIYTATDALMYKAEVATSADEMISHLSQLKMNLELRGMNKGNYALIDLAAETPANNLDWQFGMIINLLDRLKTIKNIPNTETAYQVALGDTRGIIRKLPKPAISYLFYKYRVALAVFALAWLGVGIYIEKTNLED